jgi:hypothetical protein
MKSTDAPKLDQKWWNKNKGVLVIESDFGKALGAFEVAEDQMDYAKQIAALDEITKKLPAVIKVAGKDKDTLTVVNKYPALIKSKKVEIGKKHDEEKNKAATNAGKALPTPPVKPGAVQAGATGGGKPLPVPPVKPGASKPLPTTPPKQNIGKLEKLWGKDFADEVGARLPWVKMKGFVVELQVNSDVLDLLAETDGGATAALMIKDAQEILKKYADQYVHELEGLSKAGSRSANFAELTKKAQEMFKALQPKLAAEIQAVPSVRFAKFKNDKPMWREYQIKVGVNIAIGSLQVVGGIVATAAAVPTHGATLGLAVVGLARGLYKTTTEVAMAIRSVESIQKELVSSIENLTTAYLTEKKKATLRMQVQEVGAAILAGILGADPLFVESLPKCNKAFAAWKPGVAHLRIDHGKELKEVTDLLTKTAELEKEMQKSKTDGAVKIFEKIKKIREEVTKGLNSVHKLGGRITKAEEVEPQLKESLEELNKANPNYVKVFTVLFPAAVSIGLAAGTAGVELAAAEEALEIGKAIVVLAEELAVTLKEAVDD